MIAIIVGRVIRVVYTLDAVGRGSMAATLLQRVLPRAPQKQSRSVSGNYQDIRRTKGKSCLLLRQRCRGYCRAVEAAQSVVENILPQQCDISHAARRACELGAPTKINLE